MWWCRWKGKLKRGCPNSSFLKLLHGFHFSRNDENNLTNWKFTGEDSKIKRKRQSKKNNAPFTRNTERDIIRWGVIRGSEKGSASRDPAFLPASPLRVNVEECSIQQSSLYLGDLGVKNQPTRGSLRQEQGSSSRRRGGCTRPTESRALRARQLG